VLLVQPLVTKRKNGWIKRSIKRDQPSVVSLTRFDQKGSGVGTPWKVAKIAETVTKKLIPSTKPVFERFWKGDIAKGAFTGPIGITSQAIWTHPKKGTLMRLVKNPKTGKYENVYA